MGTCKSLAAAKHDASVDPGILRCSDEADSVARCAQRTYDRCVAVRTVVYHRIMAMDADLSQPLTTADQQERSRLLASAPKCDAPPKPATSPIPPSRGSAATTGSGTATGSDDAAGSAAATEPNQ